MEQTGTVASATSERGEVVLRRRDDGAHELRVNGVFVMDTLETTSERLLAEAALAGCSSPRRVLVGGLGLGFTAHAVLADPRVEQVDVVEIEPAVVAWMRDGTVPHGPAYLADERLRVVEADAAVAIEEAADEAYDLVLLDVDNGPANLVHGPNAALYTAPALEAVRRVLAPGGTVVVWSAARSDDLDAALREVFGTAGSREVAVPDHGRVGSYWLHLASR
ncbi:hypothetical protein RDV89_15270 [Nocardioides zeae]|uniref:PABS domain-containing protein n=1 Tax=Nocardioides imazamoxiresistens TaxID=3231893 RepID=A0ABU3PYV2_9ACTN|nr:hypothetical protein [Nocardioides zeae]MDT9594443.1 hypothetical protein [Nocardioides zeae]